jgi:hypothetical protein
LSVRDREEERERREERGEPLEEFVETLCATVAGGYGRAEALEELRGALFELRQTLCPTVAADAVKQRRSRNSERCSSNLRRTSAHSDRRSARGLAVLVVLERSRRR